jgi:hypothetical protein
MNGRHRREEADEAAQREHVEATVASFPPIGPKTADDLAVLLDTSGGPIVPLDTTGGTHVDHSDVTCPKGEDREASEPNSPGVGIAP